MLEIPLHLESHISELARNSGQTVADFLNNLVAEYEFDIKSVSEADQEMQNIISGQSKMTPLSEVMRRYGLEN